MPATGLPFVCSRCGLYWGDGAQGPAFIRLEGDDTEFTFSNIGMTCPRCGTMTRPALPDGTYNVQLIRRLAKDLRSAQATRDDYARLLSLLQQARTVGQDARTVAEDIAAQTPFARLAQTIREHPPGWTAYILAAILAVVLWLIPPPDKNASTSGDAQSAGPAVLQHLSQRQLDELAQQIAKQLQHQQPPVVGTSPGVRQQKGSERNKPCSCGSKIKYKKCCGSPKRDTAQADQVSHQEGWRASTR